MAPEFNLLDEPWIRVLKKDCSEQEVSITEALIHAHEYLDLSGDMPEQDMAVLRLLLAVLHTVFSVWMKWTGRKNGYETSGEKEMEEFMDEGAVFDAGDL